MEKANKRYAIVGTGERAGVFIDAILRTYGEVAELVALCDISPTRMAWYNSKITEITGQPPLPTFPDGEFEDMILVSRPDVVIVTTIDSTHHHYIIRAMEMGCDVISEKPMTTDETRAAAIFKAINQTGRDLQVTFNYRYSPLASKVREIISEGVIGKPQHINFSWILDTSHGADYFRRWHREKDNSGGLLIHKATHHFDLINWWIDSTASEVFAMGDLRFYGKANAEARGESYDYERYTGQSGTSDDPFSIDLDNHEQFKGLYRDAESDSGYIRDKNVFSDGVTTEDTLSLTARYRSGALLTYSLVAYSPREGCQIAITGDKGRLEIGLEGRFGRTFVACNGEADCSTHIRVYPMFGEPATIEIPHPTGGHGGADPAMLEQILSPDPTPDPLRRNANHHDGAASILMGAAANRSIETGQLIKIDDLMPQQLSNEAVDSKTGLYRVQS